MDAKIQNPAAMTPAMLAEQAARSRTLNRSLEVLAEARAARAGAEAANADVEAMIWEVQHVRLGHQRMVFSIDGLEEDASPAVH
jgi:hypothetical protein